MAEYRHKNTWWISYTDSAGKRQFAPTGLPYTEEGKAKAHDAYEIVLRQIDAEKARGATAMSGPPTVKSYGDQWVAERREHGVESADEDAKRLKRYVYPYLGDCKLKDVRPLRVE
jgi:hypothetical protein